MEIKIYIDVLFLTNFFMDCALLYLSAKIIKGKIRFLRFFSASAFGALYGVFSFFIPLSPFWSSFIKIASGAVMVFITFTPKNMMSFLKHTCIFFAVSFCCGGIAFSLLYFTGLGSSLGTVVSGGTVYLNLPIYKLIFICAACYAVMTVSSAAVKKYKKLSGIIYDVTFTLEEKSVTLKAIFDSGNSLAEPLSGLSVIVVGKDALSPLFPTGKSADSFLKENKYSAAVIPYKSVAGDGKMIGFIPNKTEVSGKEFKAYVGISKTNFGDDFDALLPNDFNERIE